MGNLVEKWLETDLERLNNTGKLIKEFRLKRNLSQKQLGNILGISRNTVNKIENKNFVPSYKILANFTKALKKNFGETIEILDLWVEIDNERKKYGSSIFEKLRSDRNLTLRQLSTLLDISISYLCKIESEQYVPSYRVLRLLNEKLN